MDTIDLNNEGTLIRQLQDGNQAAFDTLFRMFHPALCFFARRLMVHLPKGLAEEIVQDAFLKLWERRVSFAGIFAVKAFLYIAVRNTCLNYVEKENVRSRRHEQYLHSLNKVEDAVVEEIIYSEVLREVAQAIETLPDRCRRIIKMASEDRLTPKEIAQTLTSTVST